MEGLIRKLLPTRRRMKSFRLFGAVHWSSHCNFNGLARVAGALHSEGQEKVDS